MRSQLRLESSGMGAEARTTAICATGGVQAPDERALVRALRDRDQAAFTALVEANSSWMLRTARAWVGSRAVAEEVVQETWLSALRSLDRFEGRSSLRTWLFTILVNAARRQAARESRSTSFSDLARREATGGESEPLANRLFDGSHPRWPDCWTTVVPAWDRLPEERLLSSEARETIGAALETLPPAQRIVFSLRDLEGWSGEEVCNALAISGSNQRVLLHRARLHVRAALERYLEQGVEA
jgi:RNA polymerase sigma-70 factor, ECF subfamily